MGYELRPKNKKIDSLHFGAFIWPIFLQETGMGYILGYGAGRTPASYVYRNGNNGSPVSNDGYIVSSNEAKMMAKVAEGFVSVQRFVNDEWNKLPEEERKYCEEWDANRKPIYRPQWHEDRLKEIEKFIEFANNSKGFSIN